jgi:DNA-binding winged helix-turn-helix (wHTH) protein
MQQSELLTIHLQITDLIASEALQELFPQAALSFDTDKDCEGILGTDLPIDNTLPFINISTLPRPVRFLDLLSLIKNLPYTRVLSFFHFELDVREKTLKNLNTSQEHRLTGKECELLRFFYQNKGQEIGRERLLKEIWEYHPDTTTHTLETHIYRLRQKLEENPTSPTILLNCKDGYMFNNSFSSEVAR